MERTHLAYSLHTGLLVLLVALVYQFDQLNMGHITKNIPLETLGLTFSNGIFFMLYNLYYGGQIGNLGTHASFKNRYGGSK
jgi:hypothetical protein